MSRVFGPGDTYSFYFSTRNVATRELADADALPTVVVWRDGAEQPESGDTLVTVTKLPARTGKYRGTFALPAGWDYGDSVGFEFFATVAGETDSDFLDEIVLERRGAAIYDALAVVDGLVDTIAASVALVRTWADRLYGALVATGTRSATDTTETVTATTPDGDTVELVSTATARTLTVTEP